MVAISSDRLAVAYHRRQAVVMKWSQSRLLFPGPNGAPLSRAALHNALRRLNAARERNSIKPIITPEKIRAAGERCAGEHDLAAPD
jgi:hypothetical protein